tara:strand:- start:2593 stop:2973 length:381 start_codon:yes stop_codon:yes gene_type:complete
MPESYLIIRPEDRLYWYRFTTRRVIDGDTIVADLDLGASVILSKQYFRLFGIDAPEKRGKTKEAGLAAQVHLQKLLTNSVDLLCKTHKDKKGKFGRWLVELYDNGTNLNQRMIEDGHALPLDEYGR